MVNIKDVIITDILSVNVIPATKGRSLKIKSRPSYALTFSSGDGVIEYTQADTRIISDYNHAVILPRGGSYSLKNLEGGFFPIINFDTVEPFTDKIFSIKITKPEQYLKDYCHLERLQTLGDNRHAELSVLYGIFSRLSRESISRHPILASAMDYIAENVYREQITNGILAKIAGVSEIHFRRTFKEHYGTTPGQYILNQKIEHSKELLREGGSSIRAVAESCGFSSVYHFSKIFKSTVGISPSEYSLTERDKG
jgi:AraC-like DNA-binding protein